MANTILIKQATLVNEGKIWVADVLIKQGIIQKIDKQINEVADIEINAEGKFLLPGLIDDQVHFREPGLTHKGKNFIRKLRILLFRVIWFTKMVYLTNQLRVAVHCSTDSIGLAKNTI